MLHIKDIEAFARINEALSDSEKTPPKGEADTAKTVTAPPGSRPGLTPFLAWGRPPGRR